MFCDIYIYMRKRIIFNIPEDLHTIIKHHVIAKNMTLTHWILKAIGEQLRQDKALEYKEALEAFGDQVRNKQKDE